MTILANAIIAHVAASYAAEDMPACLHAPLGGTSETMKPIIRYAHLMCFIMSDKAGWSTGMKRQPPEACCCAGHDGNQAVICS